MSKIVKISDKLLIFIESHRMNRYESYSDIIERELKLDEDFIETLKKFQRLNIPITDDDENKRLLKRRSLTISQYKQGKCKCKICNNIIKGKLDKFPISCKYCKKSNWFIGDNCQCEICNKIILTPNIHHIDRDRTNNHPNNLIVLCVRCHRKIHGNIIRNFHGLDIITKKRIAYYKNKLSSNNKTEDNNIYKD